MTSCPTPGVSDKNRATVGGSNWEDTLSGYVGRIPIPTSADSRSSRRHGYMLEGHGGATLLDFALLTTDSESARGATARSLNPQFSEWLMGWPINWTCSCGRCPEVFDDAPPPADCCLVRHRNERLWVCGNGVVPQVAAMAFGELFSRLTNYR